MTDIPRPKSFRGQFCFFFRGGPSAKQECRIPTCFYIFYPPLGPNPSITAPANQCCCLRPFGMEPPLPIYTILPRSTVSHHGTYLSRLLPTIGCCLRPFGMEPPIPHATNRHRSTVSHHGSYLSLTLPTTVVVFDHLVWSHRYPVVPNRHRSTDTHNRTNYLPRLGIRSSVFSANHLFFAKKRE